MVKEYFTLPDPPILSLDPRTDTWGEGLYTLSKPMNVVAVEVMPREIEEPNLRPAEEGHSENYLVNSPPRSSDDDIHKQLWSGSFSDTAFKPDPIDSYIDRFLSDQPHLITPLRKSVELLHAAELFTFATYNVDGILTIVASPDPQTELFLEIESDGTIEAGSINDDLETEELKVSRLEDLPSALQAKYGL